MRRTFQNENVSGVHFEMCVSSTKYTPVFRTELLILTRPVEFSFWAHCFVLNFNITKKNIKNRNAARKAIISRVFDLIIRRLTCNYFGLVLFM